jgi:hypothetical protein
LVLVIIMVPGRGLLVAVLVCHQPIAVVWGLSGAATDRFVDPYPEVYPGGDRPKRRQSAAVFTGNPARGGDRRGWVDVDDPTPTASGGGFPWSGSAKSKLRPPPPATDSWKWPNTTVQVRVRLRGV